MNLAFSTRGWRDKNWMKQMEDACEMQFQGIEVYNLHKIDSLISRGGPFHKYSRNETDRMLQDCGLKIPCFDTSEDISLEETDPDQIRMLFEIAGSMHIPFVAVCALTDCEIQVKHFLDEVLPDAADKKVTLLIKTSGIFANTGRLRSLLDEYACDELGCLWDVHHPYRDFGESPDSTIRNLGGYVKHVHLRDSNDDCSYNLIGEGTLPIKEIMNALSSIDYSGFISLEWKTEWMEDLSDREIIFSHFVNYMNRFDNPKGKKKSLYFNFDGTGRYVWKKDELIDETFGQVLDRMAEEFPDQYAFKYTTLNYTRTYSGFRDDVDCFARALVSLGVKPGAKVAVWATNVPAWYITFWACAKIGAVLVTMNTAYKIHEADYLLRQSDTHTLVMIEKALDSNYKEIINELCPEIASAKPGEALHCKRLPFLRNVITVDFRQPGCLTFEQAMRRADTVPQETIRIMSAHVKPDDVCNMQYTSGTTGFPKMTENASVTEWACPQQTV